LQQTFFFNQLSEFDITALKAIEYFFSWKSLMAYQDRDWNIVDYQEYSLENIELSLRGPQPATLEKNHYFVCLGAAQTYGAFCQEPFPELISRQINLPVLNLGFGGAGPDYFLQHPELLKKYINNAKFAIVQVMSGRSESNSLFSSAGMEYLTKIADGSKVRAAVAYNQLLKQNNKDYIAKIVAETRDNWLKHQIELLKAIEIPTILFWFSTRPTDYKEIYLCQQFAYFSLLFGQTKASNLLFGEFPQLINSEMIEKVKHYSNEYVECVSKRGFPQRLINRFSGKPTKIDTADAGEGIKSRKWKYNKYYPSPEMHIDASNSLLDICKKYI
jgi:hypothetical protein